MYGTTQENEKKCLGVIPNFFLKGNLDVLHLKNLVENYKKVVICHSLWYTYYIKKICEVLV
jgi:hypothetical protein